ncbi:three-Cys-motif partner protein TcmP [Streptomyces rubrogriseus]|uniref:Three-Cys-motif partner protein TcmP n=1 Tax=Streptomyces rubrogriseus TaxID=194673 RepID=A0A6G3TB03_9ACTN|nr:three-Cys-motif partner protein TcmP [Streptomyces rubrogriseus]NEC33804.1 three-Cys-motif partner protein TcmP [Streptomyces rubrogriseus]
MTAHALRGRAEKHLSAVLDRAAGSPLFAFLDPFGLGLSFDALTQDIFGSRARRGLTGRHATEVLLNFNANAVRRIGGLLTSTKQTPSKPATLSAMDAACGGDWWRQEFLDSADNQEAVRRITNGFVTRVSHEIRSGSWTIAVRNRAHHQVAYNLVLFTRHNDGMWLFGEAVSLAQVEWRRAQLPPEEDGMLWNPIDSFEEEEAVRAQEWIRTIRKNIERLLVSKGNFLVDTHQREIMAGVAGEAREMHIRAAVKELYKEGKTGCTGVGSVRQLRISSV